MPSITTIKCYHCDYEFPEDSGRYGCPNCNGGPTDEELTKYIEDTQADIDIAVHLGNLNLAGRLKDSLAKAETDLNNLRGT